jgi:outer membrane biogenesis lipoprotein LolB
MLAQIPKRKIAAGLLIIACALLLGGCATQKAPPALVSDPDAKHESQIPWNQQEKWESEGQMAGMNQQRASGH